MQINRIGMRTTVFCLSFLIGFLTANSVAFKDDGFVPNEIEQNAALETNGEHNQRQAKQQESEPLCKKYFDYSKYTDLLSEEARKRKQIVDEIDSSQNQETVHRKLKNIERKTITLQELIEQLRTEEREQRGVHTLLHTVNCAEYNESR